MSIPSTAALNQRLSSLSSMVLERSRVVSLKLPPSASTDAQIIRSLNFVRDGLNKIEEQSRTSGVDRSTGMREDKTVTELGERYDRLIVMLEEDDIGREKVKGLARPILSEPEPELPEPEESLESNDSSSTSTARPVPDVHISPPTPAMTSFPSDTPWRSGSSRGSYKDNIEEYDAEEDNDLVVHSSGTVPAERDPLFNPERSGRRGSYDPEEAELEGRPILNDQQILEDQRGVMEDQDARLDQLSHSINRHHHMSIQIGDELDLQNDLLDDTDARLDSTAARMSRAGRNLDKVAKRSKEHASVITIVGLIIILLLLIIVFKT